MLPDPLHPALVHFPIVLAFLLPVVIVLALLAIKRGAPPARAWGYVVAAAASLALASFVAVRTGSAEEDRVEEVVEHRIIHEHEEMAERTQWLAIATLVISLGGIWGGRPGRALRAVTFGAALATLILGVLTARLGGELVYTHGAADAYVTKPAVGDFGR